MARVPVRGRSIESRVVDGDGIEKIESCHSTWFFDVEARRFLRVPKSTAIDLVSLAGPWGEYLDLELRPGGSFVVMLGPDATRRLRAWRHVDPCRLCSSQFTSEVPALRLSEDRA